MYYALNLHVVVKEHRDPVTKAKESKRVKVVGLTGLEPVTPRLSSVCSNQLSYRPIQIGGAEETRTPDILLAKQALYQLSYSPGQHLCCRTDSFQRPPRAGGAAVKLAKTTLIQRAF